MTVSNHTTKGTTMEATKTSRETFEERLRRETKAQVLAARDEAQAAQRHLAALSRFEQMINPHARPRRKRGQSA